jgi:hypothetical protein
LTCAFKGSVASADGTVVAISKEDDDAGIGGLFLTAEAEDVPPKDKQGKMKSYLLLRFSEDRKDKSNPAPRIQRLELQTKLRGKVPKAHWRNGSFKTSFPSLAKVTEQYRDLPFQKIRDIIDGEISRSGENVEAFGLKIPAGALRQWGTLLILALQLYFSRHLRFMRRAHVPAIKESKSAWIGLYDDRLSRYGTILSTVALPSTACMILVGLSGVRDFETSQLSWWSCLVGGGSIALSVYLAFVTLRELNRLRRELVG